MNAKGRGILGHRFHAPYWAKIILSFDTSEAATSSLQKLGDGWVPNGSVLVWVGNSEELESCKKILGSFGADVSKIDSIATSIDHGEPFKVSIPI
jgi:hypothetical protein